MKKLLSFITLLFLIGCFNGLKEIENLDVIWNQIDSFDENTLVVFDVDETLITPIDDFFHIKSWFQIFILRSYYAIKTFDFLFKRWWFYHNRAVLQSKFQLINNKIPELIKKLQNRGVKVIALTNFPTSDIDSFDNIRQWRIKQLLDFGIDFSKSFEVDKIQFKELNASHPPSFEDGILFSNIYTEKAVLLTSFLDYIKFKPKLVVFIDDKYKNAKSVKIEMDKLKIECKVFDFNGSDKFLVNVDIAKVLNQMKILIEHERFDQAPMLTN